MTEIFEHILFFASLNETHFSELRKKRGFTVDTIQKTKLFSGNQNFLKFDKEKFNEEVLIKSGIFIEKQGLNPLLLDETQIFIPFFNKEKKCYYIRPHKLGFKGLSVEVYQEANFEDPLIITEGEFKAIAAKQLGFNAVSIPGIASFSGKHFARLVEQLNENKIHNIFIVFDNEVKDNPSLPNYKDNPSVRYDTEFYAYYMAKRLKNEGFNAKIAKLPDSWRINGKIDIDGAVAAGHTKPEFIQIIDNAIEHTEFLSNLPQETAEIVRRKDKQKHFKCPVKKEFGHYVAIRRKGEQEYTEIISNFTFKIVSTHKTSEGTTRDLMFIDEFGNNGAMFSITGESMGRNATFKTFCYDCGNYIWRGREDDLAAIWEYEFLHDDGRLIEECDHIGYVKHTDLWLFGNVAIDGDGKVLTPDANGVFWIGKKGIKPIPLSLTTGKSVISEGIPYLQLSTFPLKEFVANLADTIGINETKLVLGWALAVLYMEEVFQTFGCFPFMFITGRRGSGKSTIADWLCYLFGIETGGKMASDTTPVAMQRYLAYNSCLPTFIDEYRNTKNITWKDGFLRSAYNRQSAGKGVKSSFGIREGKVRGTFIIAGEETPEDNALLTRCVSIFVNRETRKNNHFNWFMVNKNKFSYFLYGALRNKPDNKDKFKQCLIEIKQAFTNMGVDDRTAINYAICMTGWIICKQGELDEDHFSWICNHTIERAKIQDNEQITNTFFEDILVMDTKESMKDKFYVFDRDHGMLYLYFHGVYNAWAEYYKRVRGSETLKESAIRAYLKEENGFITDDERYDFNGKRRRCMVFDINRANEALGQLAK